MYRVQAIILYKQIIRDNQIRVVIFSEEYGKITIWGKGAEGIDSGSIVEVLIERKAGQNQLKKIDTSHILSLSGWTYEETLGYLELLHMLYSALPDGSEQRDIYRDMLFFIRNIDKIAVGKVQFSLLMQARIMKILGYLNIEFYNTTLSLKTIYNNHIIGSMKSMLGGILVSSHDYHTIKESVLESRHTYSYRN